MLETLIFQWSIAIAHKFDNVLNIFKRLWDLVYIWSLLLRLKFRENTYSFERVVTLFVGYYFSSGHRVDCNNLYGYAMSEPLPTGKFRFPESPEVKVFDL